MADDERTTLTVYLLPARGGRFLLVSPELEQTLGARGEESRDGAPGEGPRGDDWTEDRDEREDDGAGGKRFLRRALRWLKARGSATERVLKELRLPETIEVVHPAGLPGHRARRIFRRRVEDSVRRHRRWLVVDGALLPVSVLLSIVPGPNLLLPYLAWRALAHWRSQRGGSRALGKTRHPEPELTFVADAELDPLLDLAERRFVPHRKRRLREIGERAGVPRLDRLV